jgi:hypothetical protein
MTTILLYVIAGWCVASVVVALLLGWYCRRMRGK